MERWLWFREERGLEQRQGTRPGGWLGRSKGDGDWDGELEAVCRAETDCRGRIHRTSGLTGQRRWRGRLRKEEQRELGCWGDMENSIWDIQGEMASMEARESPLGMLRESCSRNSMAWKGHCPWPSTRLPL